MGACVGGVMDIKPDSTGNGALAEREQKFALTLNVPRPCSRGEGQETSERPASLPKHNSAAEYSQV